MRGKWVVPLVLETAGTAGTAGGWRPIPTTMPYYWWEQVVDTAFPQHLNPTHGGDTASIIRIPGTAAYTLIRPPRVAHYVRKRF